MIIDCDSCAVRGDACSDCVVTVLLGGPRAAAGPDDGEAPIELDGPEQAALAVLAGSGMVPPLRLVPGQAEVGPDRREPTDPGQRRRAAG